MNLPLLRMRLHFLDSGTRMYIIDMVKLIVKIIITASFNANFLNLELFLDIMGKWIADKIALTIHVNKSIFS